MDAVDNDFWYYYRSRKESSVVHKSIFYTIECASVKDMRITSYYFYEEYS